MGAVVIILVPISEEVFFRRGLYGVLRPLGAWTALIVTSLLFSAVHFFLLGFPSLFLMGLVFQLVYLKTQQPGRRNNDSCSGESAGHVRRVSGSSGRSGGMTGLYRDTCPWRRITRYQKQSQNIIIPTQISQTVRLPCVITSGNASEVQIPPPIIGSCSSCL